MSNAIDYTVWYWELIGVEGIALKWEPRYFNVRAYTQIEAERTAVEILRLAKISFHLIGAEEVDNGG